MNKEILACVPGVKRGRGRGDFGQSRERGGARRRGREPSPSRAPKFLLPLLLLTPVTQGKSLLKDRTHGLTGELQIAE